MTDRYALFGNPIAHSLSPRIHAAFAAESGQDMCYEAREIAAGDFQRAAETFFKEEGGAGLNITLPFKEDACAAADELGEHARRAGAVNTLMRLPDGRIAGENTDGIGLLRDLLDNQGWQPAGSRLLLLGAGGAVRGILPMLLDQRPARLVLANRTLSKARQLAAEITGPAKTEVVGYEQLGGQSFDLVIHGTSAGLSGMPPPLPDDLPLEQARCYDLSYGAGAEPFLRRAEAAGAKQLADGLGMLVEQAAESFRLWRGVHPDTKAVIQGLRDPQDANS